MCIYTCARAYPCRNLPRSNQGVFEKATNNVLHPNIAFRLPHALCENRECVLIAFCSFCTERGENGASSWWRLPREVLGLDLSIRPALFSDWEEISAQDYDEYHGFAKRVDGRLGFDAFAGLGPSAGRNAWVESWPHTDERKSYNFIFRGGRRSDRVAEDFDPDNIIWGEPWPIPHEKETKSFPQHDPEAPSIDTSMSTAPRSRQNARTTSTPESASPPDGEKDTQSQKEPAELHELLSMKQPSYFGIGFR